MPEEVKGAGGEMEAASPVERLPVEKFTRLLISALSLRGVAEIDMASPEDRRCCTILTMGESHWESMRLDRLHEQAITRPLPHDELVQRYRIAPQARLVADLVGQGDDLARAA